MATAARLELGRLAQEAAALAGAVRGSLGPHGGQVLLTRPTGEVLLSRDGRRVLEALNVDSPTARGVSPKGEGRYRNSNKNNKNNKNLLKPTVRIHSAA
ncbi:Bardet-Biedl syndrome 10 protein homolog [Pantherophis guttatus]|uniref:Bardet-Biedl syndrome 10 protein homolog n=1 Tax=Pantherophis guttatus TaxID=94885 RepID=A0ABM3YNJ5_PANGU|nr:Bardet-Biedl syndrome 10 protein homolog [Pantherophis guttatus]